ncbi:DNA repair protein RecN [Marichromatium bheemlicum]|uniref:DNA repair protein RecN n=1 Tax=Marichromatium bheemlicum TaxID=365339 RepID=A0ABX1I8J5_9GAMM|nr:DNA repair protein RecN [Marichromatium bheemlicum]NKN33548.1 DNA repair protein RecN [Marichromatium bheemlicum]
MLTHLVVHDLAIVSAVELEFDGAMSALTGETGAGKSILIDALGLALGDKADATLVRPGQERAEIVAGFDLSANPAARDWLREHELEGDEDTCILRRLLVAKGRSRAYVNGHPTTAAQLRELGELLVDIHGQHAHQSLLRGEAQRDLLDAYGGHRALAEQVATDFRAYRDHARALEHAEQAAQSRAERLELLRFQVEELETAVIDAEELEQLDGEQRRLSHLEQLQSGAATILQELAEGEPTVCDRLNGALAELDDLAAIDPTLGEARELLETASIHAGEAAAALRHYLDGLELDPAALSRVEDRLEQLQTLARKHRIFLAQLPEYLHERRTELDALEQASVALAGLAEARDAAWGRYLQGAEALSAARAAAATRLAQTLSTAMGELGMAGGRFAVTLDPLPTERAGGGGLERVTFMVTANPGQPLQPLARVASGGELSRIGLAIQVATAACGRIPTLVFDEVDVGIGGGVAEIVGRLLRRLGAERQVLCVTHLPQVAAQAHRQLRVCKERHNGETYTRIEPLDEQARVEEIARMLGGTEITQRTRAHASEMLARAHATAPSTS